MAAKARARSRDFLRQFWSVLCHALSECFLILMLLVVAVVSYTATRFARICRIRSPCMLCSRLDKVLHGKSWFSEELVCAAHRLEIARLSYCQIHSKLAHSDDLCEKCLLSCSGPVGKPGNRANMSSKEKADTRPWSSHTQLCSCCSEPFKKRPNAHRISEEVSGRSPDDGMRKVKQRSIAMASVGHSSDENFDQLPCGGYKMLNTRCDSESEIQVSDDDDDGDAMPYKAPQRTREISCDDAQLQPVATTPTKPMNWSQVNVSNKEVGESEGVSGSPDKEATEFFAASAYDGTSSTDAHFNLNNNMENSPDDRGNLRSPRWSEVISAKETNSRSLDGPWSEVSASPRISMQVDEYRQSDADLEPSDSHVTSEDEGEVTLESLKRQCKLNKEDLSILYKELEAERSASSVAASEAMAMINRLQVEKAAIQMEALQYLRMMEEQADHDQEAIEKLNDLLTEREKDFLDMEAELENYESRFRGESIDLGKIDATDGDMAFRVLDSSDFVRSTFFDFEEEKAKILESLSRLEETLGMPSTNRSDSGDANDSLQNVSLRDHPVDALGQYVENPDMESRSPLFPQEHSNDESISSQRNDENQSVENQKDSGSCSHPEEDNISSMTSIKQEISLLNSRFVALEADQKFLKQILSSLKCSSDVEQYVQEITSQLRELRRTVTEQRDRTVL
uniref:Uncharacterized protein n=1 Tax=Avena sativa TaxID=4498 RepID=A0ACD5TU91_AVESA